MKEKLKAATLMLIILFSMLIVIPAQSKSSSIIITATGNSATTYMNPNVPPGWTFGDSCTEDVFNIVNAVLDDNIKTIYLQNGPNGEPFVFEGGAPYVWVTKPKIIEGLDARVPNDGSEVPPEYSKKVPSTRIEHNTAVPSTVRVPVFAIGGSGVTIRNLWLDSDNSGIIRYNLWGVTWILPPNPKPYGDITIEDNVLVSKKCALPIWDIECGLNIKNNYIDVQGTHIFQLPLESWTAIMVWSANPTYMTEDDVNIIGNYIKYTNAWWAVEFGGTTYRSEETKILDNTFTGSTSENYWRTFGDANLRLVGGDGEYTVARNLFVDLDSPDGCALMMRGVKNSKIYNNEFKNLQLGEFGDIGTGAIFLEVFPLGDPYNSNNMIMANDFRESGLPGWDESNPNDVGCMLLSEYTENNLVVDNLFPEGTSASEQILDYGINNKIVGSFQGEH